MLSEQLIRFYLGLDLPEKQLPSGVAVLNPYQNNPEVTRLVREFHQRYFADTQPRKLILGINPGRNGAGTTGIPFTDTPALRQACRIETTLETRETSAEFVYQWIHYLGGPDSFYREFFIGGVCPLGFVTLSKKGNWVNLNYYDRQDLLQASQRFIVEKITEQWEICGKPKKVFVLGKGKNAQHLKKLNRQEKWFQSIVALEHPRFIFQYRRKRVQEFIEKLSAQIMA